MDVELQQLIGKRQSSKGVETVAHPLDRVLLNSVQVAWCARVSNAAVIFLPEVPKALHDDVRLQVEALRAEDGQYGPPRKKTTQAPIVPSDLIEEMEEEYDD